MTYNNFRPTEECPLTKNESYRYKLSTYCGDGLKLIISCFFILTVAITITLVLQLFYADKSPQDKTGIHGAVASDYTNCSQIGTKILWQGGNAVDAAVAATICMTVVAPHKTGLGGAGYAMIYNHKEQSSPIIIDFANNTIKENGIRVPAVLLALEYMQNLKGKLSWSEVVQPSITLAKEGFVVSKEFASEVSKNITYEILYGHLNAGDLLELHDLANTLDTVAQHGTNVLYNGTLSNALLYKEIKTTGGLKDLANYKPKIYKANKSTFYEHAVYYPPHMSAVQQMILALENLRISPENASTVETQIRVAQALMNSVSVSLQMKQNIEEERYTGVMAMDWEDTYICIITGLSTPLGLKYMTSAGFLLDKVDNFNDLSALTPIIFHSEKALCGLRGVFGTDDVFLIGQILYNVVVRNLNVSTAIEYPRYYFQSDGLALENDQKHAVDALIRDQLNLILPAANINSNSLSKSVNAIVKRKDLMSSHSDSRGGGLASRF